MEKIEKSKAKYNYSKDTLWGWIKTYKRYLFIISSFISIVTFLITYISRPIIERQAIKGESDALKLYNEALKELIELREESGSRIEKLEEQLKNNSKELEELKNCQKQLLRQIDELTDEKSKNEEIVNNLKSRNIEKERQIKRLEDNIKSDKEELNLLLDYKSKAQKTINHLKGITLEKFASSEEINLLKFFLSITDSKSENEAKRLIKENNFFDSKRNPKGKGAINEFELKIFNGKEIVRDKFRGLVWQKDGAPSMLNYKNAILYIDILNQNNFGGYNNWRLPKLEEAMTLMKFRRNTALYIDPIFSNKQTIIFTSTFSGREKCWVVDFLNAFAHCEKYDSKFFVRAVRSE